MESFYIIVPLDTAIPDKHDFIFIKEVDTANGVLYCRGEQCHTRHLVIGVGDEKDTKLKCFTFDIFTLSINIH